LSRRQRRARCFLGWMRRRWRAAATAARPWSAAPRAGRITVTVVPTEVDLVEKREKRVDASRRDANTCDVQGKDAPGAQSPSRPLGSISVSGLFLTYAYRFHVCGSVMSTAPSPAGSGEIHRSCVGCNSRAGKSHMSVAKMCRWLVKFI